MCAMQELEFKSFMFEVELLRSWPIRGLFFYFLGAASLETDTDVWFYGFVTYLGWSIIGFGALYAILPFLLAIRIFYKTSPVDDKLVGPSRYFYLMLMTLGVLAALGAIMANIYIMAKGEYADRKDTVLWVSEYKFYSYHVFAIIIAVILLYLEVDWRPYANELQFAIQYFGMGFMYLVLGALSLDPQHHQTAEMRVAIEIGALALVGYGALYMLIASVAGVIAAFPNASELVDPRCPKSSGGFYLLLTALNLTLGGYGLVLGGITLTEEPSTDLPGDTVVWLNNYKFYVIHAFTVILCVVVMMTVRAKETPSSFLSPLVKRTPRCPHGFTALPIAAFPHLHLFWITPSIRVQTGA